VCSLVSKTLATCNSRELGPGILKSMQLLKVILPALEVALQITVSIFSFSQKN
jgi:hypothetical protein